MVDLFEHFQLRASAQVPVAKLRKLFAGHAIGRLAVGVHEVRIGRALVVHTQHGAARFVLGVASVGIDVINVHAVVVIAHTARPVVGFSAFVRVSGQGRVQSIACGVQDAILVPGWQHHVVEQAFFDRRKTQGLGRSGHTRSQSGATGQHGQASQTQTTTQQTTAHGVLQGLVQNVLKMRVV